MTMKSLLLGAAAGLVTVGAAQAADLPMTKAEAVEYVKVCTEFGEGFFYIPGTDTCLKIGGEIRADYRFQDRDSRDTDVVRFRTEPRLKFDARTATEWGTLRSYIQLNFPIEDGELNVVLDKGFIQFGGLTAGYAHTFFGIYDADYGDTIFAPYYSSSSTVNLLAYTAVFGGGFSATLSVEDGRDHRTQLTAFDASTLTIADDNYGGQSMPDFVANLRVDQAWGEAAIFGAVHQIRYPSSPTPLGAYDPQDADYGWAIGAGIGTSRTDTMFGGAWIALEATYASGANNYLGFGDSDSLFSVTPGFDTDQGSGWSITGEIGYDVSPALMLVAFGSYLDYSGGEVTGDDLVGGTATYIQGDTQNWVAGANATYTVVPGLSIAAEAYYQNEDPEFGDSTESWNGGVRIKRVF